MKTPQPYSIEKRTAKSGHVSYRARIRSQFGHVSRTFDRLSDAKSWAESTKADIRRGEVVNVIEKRRTPVSALIDRYLTEYLPDRYNEKEIKFRIMEFGRWRERIGHLPVGALTPSVISKMRDQMLQEVTFKGTKKSGSTVRRSLAILSHMLNMAVNEWGVIPFNPVDRVKKPKMAAGRTRFLSPEEMQDLLTACRNQPCPHLLPLVVLAIATGARKGELVSLKWKHVDWEQAVIRLMKTKNGHPRSVPLTGVAYKMMREKFALQGYKSDYVFAREDGKFYMIFEKYWQRAKEEAGLENFRFHDLRHTAASYLAMNNASLLEIAAVLGHRTMQMVQRYSHLTEQHTADVVKKMNDRVFGNLQVEAQLAQPGGLPISGQSISTGLGVGISKAQS
jgi:integrase